MLRPITFLKAFVLLSLLSDCGAVGGRADGHDDATVSLIPKGLIRIDPDNLLSTDPNKPLMTYGVSALGETNFVLTEVPCDGAAGSLLPALAIMQCSSGIVMGPVWALESAMNASSGRTLVLQGLERFHVHQEKDNLCWAAALETARKFLNLRHIPHTQMTGVVARDCPKLPEQKTGAELFQIAYTISKINHDYDGNKLNPHWCSTEKCIVDAIAHRRPVMALMKSHAVLIQAVEIASGTDSIIRKWYILDPAKDGRIESREALEMCTAAGFIAL
jgi:Papain-like cysteine protease AvrRpt2